MNCPGQIKKRDRTKNLFDRQKGKKEKRRRREEEKEDVSSDTRLIVAQPLDKLDPKRGGGFRRDLSMMQVIEFKQNLTNGRPSNCPGGEG